MGWKAEIDRTVLQGLVEAGLADWEIGWQYGVSEATIARRRRDWGIKRTQAKQEDGIHWAVRLGLFEEKELEGNVIVHHINCDQSDNRPANLIILTPSEHGKAHALSNLPIKELIQIGIVYFDRGTKTYQVNKTLMGRLEADESDRIRRG